MCAGRFVPEDFTGRSTVRTGPIAGKPATTRSVVVGVGAGLPAMGRQPQPSCPTINPMATRIIASPDTLPTILAAPGRVLSTALAPYPTSE